ncbi:Gfo/Idh/MocA family protein [Roseiflexus castenholzii]|uniref:Gfo/Idh/MocA family protein n=1 Tax=Roseiflexus castenholzii TaxID=120962 RepID=UPI0023523078
MSASGARDATHLFDMLRFFAGDARWIAATAQRHGHTSYPVEDDSTALIGFDHGVRAITHVNELSISTRFEKLHGTRGAMRSGNDGYWIGKSILIAIEQPPVEHPEFEWQRLEWAPLDVETGPPAFLLAVRELVDALEGRTALCSTGAVGRASMEMIEAICLSQLHANTAIHLPLPPGTNALADFGRTWTSAVAQLYGAVNHRPRPTWRLALCSAAPAV